MKLAERMTRIGIESAFEVLLRARALEAQGKKIIHLEIGQPDFPTPQHVKEAANERAGRRVDGIRSDARVPGFPRRHRRVHLAHPRHQRHRQERHGRARRQADHVLHDDGRARAGRRGDLSEPGVPDLRVDDQLPRRHAGADAARREPRLLVRPRHVPAEAVAADEDGRPQLAGESDRRHDPARGPGADGRDAPRARRARAERRDLLAHLLRRRAGVDHAVPRHAREDDHSRRLLEDLLDDRVASRLRRDAAVAGRCGRQADGELELVHRQLHAARRAGGAHGPQDDVDAWSPSSGGAATASSRG